MRRLPECSADSLVHVVSVFTIVLPAQDSRNEACYKLEGAPVWRWPGAGNAGSARFLHGNSEDREPGFPFERVEGVANTRWE